MCFLLQFIIHIAKTDTEAKGRVVRTNFTGFAVWDAQGDHEGDLVKAIAQASE